MKKNLYSIHFQVPFCSSFEDGNVNVNVNGSVNVNVNVNGKLPTTPLNETATPSLRNDDHNSNKVATCS